MDIPAQRRRTLGASPITVALMHRLSTPRALVNKTAALPTDSQWYVLLYNQNTESVVSVIEQPSWRDAQTRWLTEVHDRGGRADPRRAGKPPE